MEARAVEIICIREKSMTKIEKLEQDVQNLNREELAAFRKWFRVYDADAWDEQIEADVKAGKLRGFLNGIDTSVAREEDRL